MEEINKNNGREEDNTSSDPYGFATIMANMPVFNEGERSKSNYEIYTKELILNEPYFLPPESKVPKQYLINNIYKYLDNSPYGSNFVEDPRMQNIADNFNIAAVILAADQPFWLIDARNQEYQRLKESNTPYILYSPVYVEGQKEEKDKHAEDHEAEEDEHKNLNREPIVADGETKCFGRESDFEEKFSFSSVVSRQHFKIQCLSEDKIGICNVSKNGTRVITGYSEQDSSYGGIESTKLSQEYAFSLDTDFRVPTKMAVDEAKRYYGNAEWTEPARQAIEHNSITATVSLGEQPFWLIDVRDDKSYSRRGVPYLLIQPKPDGDQHNKTRDYMLEIPLNSNMAFGEERGLDKHFRFLNYKAGDCEITCSKSGDEIVLSTLFAYDNISVKASGNLIRSSDYGGRNSWVYTQRFLDENDSRIVQRDGQLFIKLGGHEYPYLHRNATSFNGCVDANISRQLDIVIDGDSEQIENVYTYLKQRYDKTAPIQDKLTAVKNAVNHVLVEACDEKERPFLGRTLIEPSGYSSKFMLLSDYVKEGIGVCRQRALLSACLLEKLQDDGLISGTIHVERNLKEYIGGHEWATFQENPKSEIYVIDPMHNVVGKKKDLLNGWDYHRQ